MRSSRAGFSGPPTFFVCPFFEACFFSPPIAPVFVHVFRSSHSFYCQQQQRRIRQWHFFPGIFICGERHKGGPRRQPDTFEGTRRPSFDDQHPEKEGTSKGTHPAHGRRHRTRPGTFGISHLFFTSHNFERTPILNVQILWHACMHPCMQNCDILSGGQCSGAPINNMSIILW